MQQEIDQLRLRSIYKMLFEMASGNFTYRIPRTTEDDELEGLLVLLNMMAEEMKTSAFHAAYINPHCTYQILVNTNIIIDKNFKIKSFTSDTPSALGMAEDSLYGKDFSSLLAAESHQDWERIKANLLQDPDYHTSLLLKYVNSDGMLIPSNCTISRLMGSSKILICSVTTVVQDNLSNEPTSGSGRKDPYRADAPVIQKLYDYILENLDAPLPSLRELARMFGTNEFKIKNGFKHFFKTSIYQFYNDERLKRAKVVIQETTTPLKNIAFMNGFSTYPNFSKAFKKRYGCAPNEVKRIPKTSSEEEEGED